MINRGILFVFSGPSGVGKDTVLRRFLEKDDRCVLSVSATTRPPREGEVGGQDYHFLSRESFETMIDGGEMLEYASYADNYYGTPKSAVEEHLQRGKNVILEIDVVGAMKVKMLDPHAVLVFLTPPDWSTLRDRLANRGTETPATLDRRMALAKEELQSAREYDYILVNDDVERCCDRLSAVITAACCAYSHMKPFLEEVISNA